MSVFSSAKAQELAAITFRFNLDRFSSPREQVEAGEADQPLMGKEDELLKALRAGEQRYFDCRQDLEAIRRLRKFDHKLPKACAGMATRLRSIKDDLTELDHFSRRRFNSIAQCQSSSIEVMHEHFEKLIEWLTRGAELHFPPQPKMPGKKPGMSNSGVLRPPLEEFAKEIQNFLTSPEVQIAFSFEAKPRVDLKPESRELISAAARLLYEAARVLEPNVEVADIDAVVRAVRHEPEFREELLDDPSVDALTN